MQRFKLAELPNTAEDALDRIARKRGCLRPGGIADLHKASEVCLHELRAGKIGTISLENPEMVEQELAAIEALKAAALEAEENQQNADNRSNRSK